MSQFFADGTVSAEVFGEGTPLVLFHSLLSDRTSFDRIIPNLAERFRVIVPELPGFGASQAVAGGLPAVADRMAACVREAAAGNDVIVLGNGYGGFVALQMAIRHPGIASRLILADCGAAFSEPGRDAFRGMAGAARTKGLAAITPVAMRRLFAPDYQQAHPELMREREAAFLRTDVDVFEAACLSLAQLDLRPDLAKVAVPVLVMVGDQDEATPPPMSEELNVLLSNARLHVLKGCAHVPQLQAPEAFLEAVDAFLLNDTATRAA
jgi:3-oxoadipate enol-lactonase